MSYPTRPPEGAALPAPVLETRAVDSGRRVVFMVAADADPGTLPRVLELVAKRGLVPVALRAGLAATTGSIDLSLTVDGLASAESSHIANCLRSLPMVASVTVAESRLD